MANSKISALTSATTPLAGTEEVPIVQSGATVKATVASFTGAGNYAGSFTSLAYTTTLTGGTGIVNLGSGQFYKSATGIVGIGTTTVTSGSQFRVLNGSALNIELTNSATDATNKIGQVTISRYTNSQTQFTALRGSSTATTNSITIGGGSGAAAPATDVAIYTGALSAVAGTGTERMRIDSSGNVGIGTTTPVGRLDVFAASGGGAGTVVPVSITVGDTSSGNAWPGDGTLSTVFNYFSGDGTNNGVRFRHGVGETNTSGSTSVWKIQYRAAGGAINSYTGFSNALTVDTSGNVLVTGVGGLGYGTGSGGTVTQVTSRTTGVTLNKTNGAITLVSGAGLATFQSFTVTNSTVAATDVVHVTQKSGTDLYQIFVTATAAGSFQITFATTGGITVEQPVFNFAVIKGVTA
jgi:hypothetical protein